MNVCLVVARTAKGEIKLLYFGEASDPALELHEKLRKSKGRDSKGELLYTDSALFIRPKTNRRLHFS